MVVCIHFSCVNILVGRCVMFAGSLGFCLFPFSPPFLFSFFPKICGHGTASDLLPVGVRDYTPHFYT